MIRSIFAFTQHQPYRYTCTYQCVCRIIVGRPSIPCVGWNAVINKESCVGGLKKGEVQPQSGTEARLWRFCVTTARLRSSNRRKVVIKQHRGSLPDRYFNGECTCSNRPERLSDHLNPDSRLKAKTMYAVTDLLLSNNSHEVKDHQLHCGILETVQSPKGPLIWPYWLRLLCFDRHYY